MSVYLAPYKLRPSKDAPLASRCQERSVFSYLSVSDFASKICLCTDTAVLLHILGPRNVFLRSKNTENRAHTAKPLLINWQGATEGDQEYLSH
jgi:hypothetical protein